MNLELVKLILEYIEMMQQHATHGRALRLAALRVRILSLTREES